MLTLSKACLAALWRGVYAVIVWCCAPILDTDNRYLSLGRTLLFSWSVGWLAVAVHLAWTKQLAILLNPNGGGVALVLIPLLVFAAYCWGDKPHVKEILLAIVGRLPTFGSAPATARVAYQAPAEPPYHLYASNPQKESAPSVTATGFPDI